MAKLREPNLKVVAQYMNYYKRENTKFNIKEPASEFQATEIQLFH